MISDQSRMQRKKHDLRKKQRSLRNILFSIYSRSDNPDILPYMATDLSSGAIKLIAKDNQVIYDNFFNNKSCKVINVSNLSNPFEYLKEDSKNRYVMTINKKPSKVFKTPRKIHKVKEFNQVNLIKMSKDFPDHWLNKK